MSQISYYNVKIICSCSSVFLLLAVLILDNFPLCFHFLPESLLFLDCLGWFSVPLNSEQWKWQLKGFQDLSCLFPALIYLALNLRTMEWLTLGRNFGVHVVQSSCWSSQEPTRSSGTYRYIPSGHLDLCMDGFLKHYLISSSSTKNKSSLVQNFPSSPGLWIWGGKKKF